MYCAFAAVVASVVSCSAPLPAGAVASVTKFTAPPGRVSAVDQPCVLVGLTTTVAAVATATRISASVATAAPSEIFFFMRDSFDIRRFSARSGHRAAGRDPARGPSAAAGETYT